MPSEDTTAEEMLKNGGPLKGLQKRLIETASSAGPTDRLGDEKRGPEGRGTGNARNGATRKRVVDGDGDIEINVPRDRNGDFEPKFARKCQIWMPDFDEKALWRDARRMTARTMQFDVHLT